MTPWRASRTYCPWRARARVTAACALAHRVLRPGAGSTPQAVREAVGAQQRLQFGYQDAQGQRSERIVWPFALGYFDEVPMLAAWCERREDFRHFRLDRIRQVRVLENTIGCRVPPCCGAGRRGHRTGLAGPFVTSGPLDCFCVLLPASGEGGLRTLLLVGVELARPPLIFANSSRASSTSTNSSRARSPLLTESVSRAVPP